MIKVMFGVFGGLLLFTHGDVLWATGAMVMGEIWRWLPLLGMCVVWLVLGIMKEM